MLVPDKAVTDTQPKVKVKAFSIYGIDDAERAKLQEDIDRAREEAMKYASRLRGSSGLRNLEGTVAIHNETSLLVATGPESFVDMVESIVNACLAKERARNPAVPMALPSAPGK
jgi:ActR/RegA family two-component response regulator